MGKAQKELRRADPTKLNPFNGNGKRTDRKGKAKDIVNAVIETPGGSRNKFKYDPDLGFFALSGVLPEGMVFPHAFGFVPQTKAADGDPEDVLILMDEPSFAGCIVPSRLIGVIEAEQTETDGKSERNDRLVAVAAHSRDYSEVQTFDDLNKNMLKELEQFFVNYNKERGKKFRVLQMRGPQHALKLLKKSLR
ncbi:MAG: inorganic diphosphatase [Candidatus Sulfotelmatobacter sp.]